MSDKDGFVDLPRTRAEALLQAASRYRPLKSCRRGHIPERYTKDQSCVACRAEDREAKREKNAAYFRAWREANPGYRSPSDAHERENARSRARYAANPEKIREAVKAWRRANPEKTKDIAARSAAKNKDKLRASAARYQAENREIIRARQAAYRANRRAEMQAKTIAWRRANPEKAKTADRNKRVRRKGAPGRHTAHDVDRIRKQQRHRCAMCRTDLRKSREHVDHIIPLVRGGGNNPSNLQLLCPPCNLRKKDKDPIDFARSIGRLL